MKIDYSKVSERLLQIRKVLGLSQKEIADKLFISKAYWSALERGDRTPSAHIIKVLKHTFDISSDWLLLGKGNVSEKDLRVSEVFKLQEIENKMNIVLKLHSRIIQVIELREATLTDSKNSHDKYLAFIEDQISLARQSVTLLRADGILEVSDLTTKLDELIIELQKDFDQLFEQFYLDIYHPRRRKNFEAPKNVKLWCD